MSEMQSSKASEGSWIKPSKGSEDFWNQPSKRRMIFGLNHPKSNPNCNHSQILGWVE